MSIVANVLPSAYDRLGGEPAIAAVVDELYRRAIADEELGQYFHSTNLDAQRLKLTEMIAEALGGPTAPWLSGLREAHSGRGVTHRHFSLMAAHLIDVLGEHGVDEEEQNTLMNWIAAGRDAVVAEPHY